jgi:hypothetical protein
MTVSETEMDYILFSERGEIEISRAEYNWITTGLLKLLNEFSNYSKDESDPMISAVYDYRARSIDNLLDKLERVQIEQGRSPV